MSTLVIHPQTQQRLEAFMQVPGHAILLSGPAGSGKRSLAIHLGSRLLAIDTQLFGSHPYSLVISPAGVSHSTGIDAIREMGHFLSLKVPAQQTGPQRMVIIEEADRLTLEAQNALLKTLEEPPAGTVLIMTTAREQTLLPTIRSRLQRLTVRRPDRKVLEQHFADQGFDTESIARAMTISGGLPGLMKALLLEVDHPLLAAAAKARGLLSQTTYQRLLQVDELARDRPLCLNLCFVLQQMAAIGLQSNGQMQKRWQTIAQASYEAATALHASAQPKLVLTDFLLRL